MKSAEYYIDLILKSKLLSFLGLFLIFILFNMRILSNPPYGDEILGLHNQAIWLAENNFDFSRLYKQEQIYDNGGSLTHAVGTMAMIYGIMYYFLPPLAVHIIGHLINLAVLAFAGMLSIRLLSRFCDSRITVLWIIAIFTEPLLGSRMAAQDQDTVLTGMIVFSFFQFFNKRFYSAILLGIFCCLIKLTGIVMLAAYLVWFTMAYIRDRKTDQGKIFIRGTLSSFFAIVLVAILFLSAGFPSPSENTGIFNLGLIIIKRHTEYFYLWLFPTLLAACVLFLVILYKNHWKNWHLEYFIFPILIFGYFFAYFTHPAIPQIPRYTVIVVIPILLFLAYSSTILNTKTQILLAFIVIFLNIFNMRGLLLFDIPAYYRAEGSQLERSREHLDIVDSDRKLCRFIEQNKPENTKILCKWPHAQMLTMPKLRYVKEPVKNVFCLGIFPKYSKAKKITELETVDENTWILYAPNCFDLQFLPSLAPLSDNLRIIYRDGNELGIIYSGIRLTKQKQALDNL